MYDVGIETGVLAVAGITRTPTLRNKRTGGNWMAPDVMGIIFDRPFMMGVYLVFLASLSIINMARPGHPVMLGTWVTVSYTHLTLPTIYSV